MKTRWIWIGVATAVIVLVGGVYYTRNKPVAQPQRVGDPGFQLILAIRTLERTPETQLTKEQITRILPFLKALKDVSPSDAEAADVIAQAVRDVFTPEQRAALEEARKRFQERMRAQGAQAGGGSGSGEGGGSGQPGPGAGAQLSDERRAQSRISAFDRMIRVLERRMK